MKTQKLICAVVGLAFIGASQSLIGKIPIGPAKPKVEAARIRLAVRVLARNSLKTENKILKFSNMIQKLSRLINKTSKEDFQKFVVNEMQKNKMQKDKRKLLASTLADMANKINNDQFQKALKEIIKHFSAPYETEIPGL